MHVTLRVCCDVPSLRSKRLIREFRASLVHACERGDFRVVHYSLQGNHAHLLVEAEDKAALARGMKSIGARLAQAVNGVFGRSGQVLDGRYHAKQLETPRQVRAALRYVLLNARGHAKRSTQILRIDPASSGRWFDGRREPSASNLAREDPAGGRREVARAKSWLLQRGWRWHGLIGLGEVPGPAG